MQAELAQLRAPADLHAVVSPRNEAATVANLVSLWRNDPDYQHMLDELYRHSDAVTRQWGGHDTATTNQMATNTLPLTTSALMDALDTVDTSRCHPAMYGGMRGMACATTMPLRPGDTVVSIPANLLIHDGIAAASDLVQTYPQPPCVVVFPKSQSRLYRLRVRHWHASTSTLRR